MIVGVREAPFWLLLFVIKNGVKNDQKMVIWEGEFMPGIFLTIFKLLFAQFLSDKVNFGTNL